MSVVASQEKKVYILQYQDGEYMPSLSCPLENGYPVSINFSEDNNSIIVCTNQRRMFVRMRRPLHPRA